MNEHKQIYSNNEIYTAGLRCIDLGCGKKKLPGYIGIDVRKFDEVEVVLDLEKDTLPFKDNSIDAMNCEQVLEHLECKGLFHIIDECWRVLKPEGFIRITVPRFPCGVSVLHPDHKRFFMPDTFGFFQVPSGDIDPHGYLNNHFWHVSVISDKDDEIITVIMYPNKIGGKYPYKEIKDE